MLNTSGAKYKHHMCGASAHMLEGGKKDSFFYVINHYKALLIDLQADEFSALHIDFVYNNRRLRREIV